ncbi:M1 family metallopeptidase [Streptomyces sp. SID3343]|uniref:M1 family aminopeptidase n=1 Tax=Streptomyces sp. SID3343 TaxID=2690260 RepID=UPI00136D86EC|nr:M1 family peptidase [Streptomyces sp. SID3343]
MRIAAALFTALATLLAGVGGGSASARGDEPADGGPGVVRRSPVHPGPVRTPAAPSYTVELSGDATGRVWTGNEQVSFVNTSADPLREVYLRLWDNAHGTCAAPPITVSDVGGGVPGELTVDCTALRIVLPTPLSRGRRGSIRFGLRIEVPDGADRFGHRDGYSFLGNALPVLAIRDAAGWHLDPYTNHGESFYSPAADFHVVLDHPAHLRVPATGTSVDSPGAAGRTVTTATARRVRDFAWAAGPYVRISRTSPAGVRINVYAENGISPSDARSMLDVAVSAVDANSRRFGAYPYTEVDVVLAGDLWFGGMEYPGLVLDRVDVVALTHEIAHQWWYGIVGNDEYTDPWLDEAFAEYATDLALAKAGQDCRQGFSWASPAERLTASMRYWDAHPARYEAVVYEHGKCTLHELRRLIGDAPMDALMRGYAADHWYGVSTPAEFKSAAQAATRVDLTAFWAEHRVGG